jgi:hypothetical protein
MRSAGSFNFVCNINPKHNNPLHIKRVYTTTLTMSDLYGEFDDDSDMEVSIHNHHGRGRRGGKQIRRERGEGSHAFSDVSVFISFEFLFVRLFDFTRSPKLHAPSMHIACTMVV